MSRIEDSQLGVINWEDFERAVKVILGTAGAKIENFKVNGKKKFQSDDGEYEIDGSVEFTMLGGARFLVLIECKSKKTGNGVKRDEVLAFHSKIESLKAQKGIFFTTSTFQKGAIEYAKKQSIALVQVVKGETTYITKGAENVSPPPWLNLPEYAGWLVSLGENSLTYSLVRPEIGSELLTSK